jgi:hypothetical protein
LFWLFYCSVAGAGDTGVIVGTSASSYILGTVLVIVLVMYLLGALR